jgi:hypothetical protein
MIYGGTVSGFLLGFWGSLTQLQTEWEDGSFIWVFAEVWGQVLKYKQAFDRVVQ